MDFLRWSSIFQEFSSIFIDFHRFPAEIPASSFISSWDLCLAIHFQLGSQPPHSFPAGITASPFISSWDPCLRLGELSGTLSRSRSPNKSQFWAQNVWKTIRIYWFLPFLAPKRKSVCNFFKITTTFTVQIAIYWPCFSILFRPDSRRHRPIFGGPRGRNPQIKTTISPTPTFGEIWRNYPTLRTSVPTPPSRAHPKDDLR